MTANQDEISKKIVEYIKDHPEEVILDIQKEFDNSELSQIIFIYFETHPNYSILDIHKELPDLSLDKLKFYIRLGQLKALGSRKNSRKLVTEILRLIGTNPKISKIEILLKFTKNIRADSDEEKKEKKPKRQTVNDQLQILKSARLIEEVQLKENELNKQNLVDYFNWDENTNALILQNKYRIIGYKLRKDLINFIFQKPFSPKVRSKSGKLKKEEWDNQRIINYLTEKMLLDDDTAKKYTADLAEILSFYGVDSLSKASFEIFVIEYLINEKKELVNTKNEKKELVNTKNLPIVLTVDKINKLTKMNPLQPLHYIIGKYQANQHLINQFPLEIQKLLANNTIFIHAMENIFQPLNVSHDLRFLIKTGLFSSQPHTKPPRNLNSALDLTTALLESTREQIGGCQTIPHFNYFIAPYVESIEELDKPIEGFLKNLGRSFKNRIVNPVYSLLMLDTDPSSIESLTVYKSGLKLNDSYINYEKKANEVTKVILDKYIAGLSIREYKDEYPKIAIQISSSQLQEFIEDEDHSLATSIFTVAQRSNSLFLVNQNSSLNIDKNVSYFSDSSRISSRYEEWQSHSLKMSLTLDPLKIDKQLNNKHLNDVFQDIRKLVSWKKEHVSVKLNHSNTIEKSGYVNFRKGDVLIRLLHLKEMDNDLISEEVKSTYSATEFVNIMKQMCGENSTEDTRYSLGQTSALSGAHDKFRFPGMISSPDTLYNRVDYILYDTGEMQVIKDNLIQKEAELQNLLNGGSVLRVFLVPKSNTATLRVKGNQQIEFFKMIKRCFDNDISCINFRTEVS